MSVTGLGTGQSATGTAVATIGAAAAIGDRVLACVVRATIAALPVITDSKGNTWTSIGPPHADTIGCFIYQSILTTALAISDTVTSTCTGATIHGIAVLKISDTMHATPIGKKAFYSYTGLQPALWTSSFGREWFTDTTYIVVGFATGNTLRTNTPNTNWTELYDVTVATTRALAVIYREVTGEVEGDPGAGGTWSGTVSNGPSAGVAFHRATGSAVSRVNKLIVPRMGLAMTRAARVNKIRSTMRRSPRREIGSSIEAITSGQYWPRR